MKRTASDQGKVRASKKPRLITAKSGRGVDGDRGGVFLKASSGWSSRTFRSADRIWALLCEAQRLAPDNVNINLQLWNCWPEHLPYCELVDAIANVSKHMSRESLLTYIVELDAELIDPLMHLLDQMEESVRLVRVRINDDSHSRCWGAQWMRRRDLLVRLLANQPRCAKGYRMLAETLNNSFERIFLEYDQSGQGHAGAVGFNRMQLLERAELLDPAH